MKLGLREELVKYVHHPGSHEHAAGRWGAGVWACTELFSPLPCPPGKLGTAVALLQGSATLTLGSQSHSIPWAGHRHVATPGLGVCRGHWGQSIVLGAGTTEPPHLQ